MVCQPTSGQEKDATLDLTCAAGRLPLVGSRMTIWHSRRWSFWRSIPQAPGWLVSRALPFLGAGKRRRKGSWTSTLGLLLLCYWMCVGQKTIKGHCSFNQNFTFTLVGFCFRGVYWLGCCLLGRLNLGLGLLNGFVDSTTLGDDIY